MPKPLEAIFEDGGSLYRPTFGDRRGGEGWRVQEISRTAIEKEHLDQQDELLKIITEQRLHIKNIQAQLDMTTGSSTD